MTIDNNVYRQAELYARMHNISVERLVEQTIMKMISLEPNAPQPAKSFKDTEEFKNAMAYMETLVADDLTSPVASDEDGRDERTEKFKL